MSNEQKKSNSSAKNNYNKSNDKPANNMQNTKQPPAKPQNNVPPVANVQNVKPAQDKLNYFKEHWQDIFKPLSVLSAICLITALLLGIVNEITLPIIKEMEIKIANETRQELLPQADDFTQVRAISEGVTDMYKANNGTGYVFTATAKGYGGAIPVMVAINSEHKIVNVKFLANNETPGLGQKILQPKFATQFAGKETKELSLNNIDAITGATISSSAAVSGINSVLTMYNKVVKGEKEVELTPEEIRAKILPEAGAITKLDTVPTEVTQVYKGEVYGYIIYAESIGFYKKPLPVAVGFDNDGAITGVYIDAKDETKDVGSQVGKEDFTGQFTGMSELSGVEAVTGATVSSKASIQAVQKAIDAFKLIKGA